MPTPTILGFPVWRGRIKRRVAKKYLRFFRNLWMLGPRAQRLGTLGVGDFINDCTGLNGRIEEMRPTYRRIGKGRGAVLLDVDIQTQNTGCSLCSCGIEPKLSRDVIESRMVAFNREWTLGDGGKRWYGDTEDGRKAAARALRIIAVVDAGGHVTDEDGRLLPEFDRDDPHAVDRAEMT